jgi:3-oxoadipate enol-lactonase
VCLEVATRRPDLVTALVLLDAPLPDHDPAEEFEAYDAEEDRLYEAGDVAGVTDLNVEFWVGGAAPEVKEAVRVMQRRAVELQLASESEPQEPGTIDLGHIEVPVLVVDGDRDKPDFRAIARRLAAELPNARAATVAGAGHLPALERPEETARLVLAFLERLG